MKQTFDSGETVSFGQPLDEIERLFSCNAIDKNLPISRKGIDKIIKVKNLTLEFDSERLCGIGFNGTYRYSKPTNPFPDPWKNFPTIGDRKIQGGLTRDEFLDYLIAWEKRAQTLGVEKVNAKDLTSTQYAVAQTRNRSMDMIQIAMGPTRRTRTGGLWSDGWSVFFSMGPEIELFDKKLGVLKSIFAFSDEYNTVARA